MHLVRGICVLKEATYLALNNLFLRVQISKLAMHTDETGRRDFLLPYKSLNPENQILALCLIIWSAVVANFASFSHCSPYRDYTETSQVQADKSVLCFI